MNKPSDSDILQQLEADSISPSTPHDEIILQAAKSSTAIKAKKSNWPMAIAAVVVAGVIGVIVATNNPLTTDESLRAVNQVDVVPVSGSDLKTPPRQFSWQSEDTPETTRSCRVELRDSSAALIWTSQWQDTPLVRVPESIRKNLTAPARYTWLARCQSAGISEIGPFAFSIQAN